jgi:hypothetical protein
MHDKVVALPPFQKGGEPQKRWEWDLGDYGVVCVCWGGVGASKNVEGQ